MCYHISFQVSLESITDYFPDIVVDAQLQAEFPTTDYINGFDHGFEKIMLIGRKDGKRHLAPMMWGMVPDEVNNFKAAVELYWNDHVDENGNFVKGKDTLNAMGETILQRPLYRDSAINRRCILFVDAFYEWRHINPIGKKGQPLKTTVAYPYHINLMDSEMPFIMMAAIWRPWRHTEPDEETGEMKTLFTPCFASCTTKANKMMAQVHNKKERMPTILTRELAEEWMQPGLSEKRIVEIATYQYPSEKMKAYSIHKEFQNAVNPKDAQQYEVLTPITC